MNNISIKTVQHMSMRYIGIRRSIHIGWGLIALLVFASYAHGQNLIYNGSFTAQPASQWNPVPPGTNVETFYPETAYGGTLSTNVVAEVDGDASLKNTGIPVVAGEAYHFAYRYSRRTDNGPASNPNTINIRIYNGTLAFLTQSVAASNASWLWQCYTGTFIASTNTVSLDMTNQDPAGVTLGTLVDDITITPVNQPITLSGLPCQGRSVTLSAPNFPNDPDSKYSGHSWTGPNGFTATGPSITLNNVQPGQSGTYTCSMTLNTCLQVSGQYQLTISPYIAHIENVSICQGQSYTFNGITYTTANNTAKDTFQTTAGCDSIVTLNLTVSPYLTGTDMKNICQGQSYTFNGVTYITANNTATDTFQTTAGCDSIVTLNLTVSPYLTGTDIKNICQGQSYTFNGVAYTTANNTATDTFQTTAGCDSIVTLNLTVNPYLTGIDIKTICQGQSYTFNGVTYTTANNTATDTFQTIAGCDSIVTLNLTVNPYLTGIDVKTICQGQSYTFNGVAYTTANNTAKDTFQTIAGCDSIVTLNLTVSPYLTSTDIKTICQGQRYIFNGVTYTTTNNTATDTFATAGCDSIVTLNLTVSPYLTGTDIETICEGQSYTFNGVTYTTTNNTATDTLQTTAGCDSIVKLSLTVRPYLRGTDVKAICQGQSYTFNGITYTMTNNTATDTLKTMEGCDSIVTLDLTVNPLPEVGIDIVSDRMPSFCTGDSVTLRARGATTYSWQNNSGLTIGNSEMLEYLLKQPRNIISVTGIDDNHCTDTAQIVINTEACCQLYMPNAFSPNNDGLNDEIGPVTRGHPFAYVFRIFNRWGQLVFASFKVEDRWNGRMDGKAADVGTYFYVISGHCASGEPINLHGDIVLVR